MATWRCQDCPALFGAWLSRCPRCASTKELVMALNVCTGCTAKYAVGLSKCPQCGSTDYVEDGQPMPKITEHGGPSSVTAGPDEPGYMPPVDAPAEAEAVEPEPVPVEPESASEEGGAETSPGTDFSAPEEPEELEPSPEPDYEAATVEQIKEQLGERGLPKTGKRDDLVARLREDDETRAHAEPATGSGEAGELR